MKFAYCAPLLFVLVGSLHGQESSITPDTPVNLAMLHEWLHSGDPRLIAWAADFARTRHDTEILGEMPELLERWPVRSEFGNGESQAAQRRAVLAVLDALVQEKFQVPTSVIQTIAAAFPAQAAILIASQPLSESRSALDYWVSGRTGELQTGQMLARVAAMMLAKDPIGSATFENFDPSGFVAEIVTASENQLQISIRAKGSGVGGGLGGGTCCDSFGRSPTPGWPEVYTYHLAEEHDSAVSGSIVVELDGDRIFYSRSQENAGWGSCSSQEVEPLDPTTRHRLIAHWLGVRDNEMLWQPVETFKIVWEGKAAYTRRLSEVVEAQRKKLQTTVDVLMQRGFLSESEAKTVMPKLVVKIQCDMNPCPL